MEKNYTRLHNVELKYGVLWGFCSGDYLKRFTDGTYMHTSGLVCWDYADDDNDVDVITYSGTRYRMAIDDMNFTIDELTESVNECVTMLKSRKK